MEIRSIPGTDVDFTIRRYKEDLRVGYSSIVVYLMEHDDELAEDDASQIITNRYFSNLLPL